MVAIIGLWGTRWDSLHHTLRRLDDVVAANAGAVVAPQLIRNPRLTNCSGANTYARP